VAPFVCYDLRFPEIFRHAVRRGAELLVVMANWPEPRDSHWRALLPARAIENQCFLVGANRVGSDPHVRYAGHSVILDSKGEPLATADSQAKVISWPIARSSQPWPTCAASSWAARLAAGNHTARPESVPWLAFVAPRVGVD
jgi:predicted amidohydrolase